MSIESYIIDGGRSPIGIKNGDMVGVRSDDLSAMVIKGVMARNKDIPPEAIEDVVIGCAFPEGPQGMLMARAVSILSDLPIETGGKVVNRFCGSSMDSVHQLSQAILAGDIDAGIAVGCTTVFIDWGYKEKLNQLPNKTVIDLKSGIDWILEHYNKN